MPASQNAFKMVHWTDAGEPRSVAGKSPWDREYGPREAHCPGGAFGGLAVAIRKNLLIHPTAPHTEFRTAPILIRLFFIEFYFSVQLLSIVLRIRLQSG